MHNKVFWLSKPFLIELFLVLEENKFNLENLLKLAFGTVILIVFVNYFRQQFYNNKIGLILILYHIKNGNRFGII